MTFIITAILLVCIGAVSGYFYRKHAAQVKPQPDGTIRAKLPSWYRFCGYFLVAGGILFALITPALISGSNPMPPYMAFGVIGICLVFGVWAILMGQRQYVETGVDYIEQCTWYGKVTRIPFHEIDSYAYSSGHPGGWLVLKTVNKRKIAFTSRYLRGERVMCALVFRQVNGRWPSPTNPEDQQVLVQEASLAAAPQYLTENPIGQNLSGQQV